MTGNALHRHMPFASCLVSHRSHKYLLNFSEPWGSPAADADGEDGHILWADGLVAAVGQGINGGVVHQACTVSDLQANSPLLNVRSIPRDKSRPLSREMGSHRKGRRNHLEVFDLVERLAVFRAAECCRTKRLQDD